MSHTPTQMITQKHPYMSCAGSCAARIVRMQQSMCVRAWVSGGWEVGGVGGGLCKAVDVSDLLADGIGDSDSPWGDGDIERMGGARNHAMGHLKCFDSSRDTVRHDVKCFDSCLPRKAPRNSQMTAIKQACFTVSDLEPTAVAKEFATSLAPIPKAHMKEAMAPSTTNHT